MSMPTQGITVAVVSPVALNGLFAIALNPSNAMYPIITITSIPSREIPITSLSVMLYLLLFVYLINLLIIYYVLRVLRFLILKVCASKAVDITERFHNTFLTTPIQVNGQTGNDRAKALSIFKCVSR